MDGLLELLPMSGELLDAGSALHVPQTDGAVVTWGGGVRTANQKVLAHRRRAVRSRTPAYERALSGWYPHQSNALTHVAAGRRFFFYCVFH